MVSEPIHIHFGDQIVRLKQISFDTDIDPDDLTKIHYENLFGEVVTISALLNRVGLIKAEVEAKYNEEKIELQIYEANLRKQFRSMSISEGHKLSVQELEDKVSLDLGWQNRAKKLVRYQKDCSFLDSLYWAVQSKDKKLSVLLKPLTPEEFIEELIPGMINGFELKVFEKSLSKKK